MAPSRSATAMTWLAGTKRNVGFLSMNRVISHGQAMRSTRAFSRVTHFISDLPLLLRLDAVGLVERSLQALSEFRRVVVGRGRRRAAQRRSTGRQGLAQCLRQLDRVAVALVVHVHDVRRHLVEVIVNGGDLEPAAEEAGHHRGHFLVEQDEVTHDHRTVAHLFEGRVGSEGKPRLDRHTLHGDREIGPRHPDTEDIARLELARFAERLLYRLPVGVGGAWRGWCDHDAHEPEKDDRALGDLGFHDAFSLEPRMTRSSNAVTESALVHNPTRPDLKRWSRWSRYSLPSSHACVWSPTATTRTVCHWPSAGAFTGAVASCRRLRS